MLENVSHLTGCGMWGFALPISCGIESEAHGFISGCTLLIDEYDQFLISGRVRYYNPPVVAAYSKADLIELNDMLRRQFA